MALTPRLVLVHRRTELEELVDRHGTRGQAEFFLRTRGRDLSDVQRRHDAVQDALQTASTATPASWRRGSVERADLSRYLFSPDDVVLVVGQDGLLANVAKYLDGQPVVGVNPEPGRNPGALVPHYPAALATLLPDVVAGRVLIQQRTMVEAVTDDGQQLVALNEIYLGHASHQSARYVLTTPDGRTEAQSSSGLLTGTGTGATGWLASAAAERRCPLPLTGPADPDLAWFVREAWPSPATGTTLTAGTVPTGRHLEILVQHDALVAFGDGLEDDHLTPGWGQTVRIGPSAVRLSFVA